MAEDRLRIVEEKVTRLDTMVRERFSAIEIRNEIVFEQIKEELTAFTFKFERGIEQVNERPLICMKEMRLYVDKQVTKFIGIPVSIFILIKIVSLFIPK